MKTFDQIKESFRINVLTESADGFSAKISLPNWLGTVVCSTGAGWEHVSVSPEKIRVTPSWNDMCIVKDIFWNEDEAVIQIHPAKADYVNNMPNCLHLWRCTYKEMTIPPSVLVGVRKGQTVAEVMSEIKEAYRIAGENYE